MEVELSYSLFYFKKNIKTIIFSKQTNKQKNKEKIKQINKTYFDNLGKFHMRKFVTIHTKDSLLVEDLELQVFHLKKKKKTISHLQ